ncbi:MAG: hypothetical protein HQ541_22330 [Mariniphaga sp.]|nr:hypothetical protein [Mariniphaga sp.]
MEGFKIFFLISFLSIVGSNSFAQVFNGDINTSTIINSNSHTPFWIWANQLGHIPQNSKFIQTGEINLELKNHFKNGNTFFMATKAFGSKGEVSHFELTELYVGFKLGRIIASVGSRADSLIQEGLSSSNGNFLNSRNAKPYPRISLDTDGFIKIGKRNFSIAGKWEEGILLDERMVDKPRLHHKNLLFRIGDVQKFQFEIGIDHYVFWGGDSPKYGPQPKGFTDYLRAILAMRGGDQHTQGDQDNVAGNSLGQYFFIFRKKWQNVDAEIRIIHPFEDKSGIVLFNTVDNLYSLYLTFNENQFLKYTLLEFIYTKNQSGDDIQDGVRIHTNGRDDYLTHSFYNSGFTYFGNVMGSSLFYPINYNSEGISTGIANNRFVAFHFGASGKLSNTLNWKMLYSYSYNYGTYWVPFDTVRNQLSGLFEFKYEFIKAHLYLKTLFAFDRGSNINNGMNDLSGGARLTVGWRL